MAGSLVLIDSETVSSGVSAVTLTGIDSTYDVYVVHFLNVECSVDNEELYMRVTTSGTADSDSEYDWAMEELKSYASYGENSNTGQTQQFLTIIGTPAQEQANATLYLFNFNNSSEYSFWTIENVNLNSISKLSGGQGGGVHTVAEANDGVSFFMDSGNIDSGEFKLYGLKK
tara:strand:- start:12 stop:527 length:516 start_codon:yes stop_codon:yes gene_type:complete